MRAIVMESFGGPDVLRLAEVPTPDPAPDEIVVAVEAVSINRSFDLQRIRNVGKYGNHRVAGLRDFPCNVRRGGGFVELGRRPVGSCVNCVRSAAAGKPFRNRPAKAPRRRRDPGNLAGQKFRLYVFHIVRDLRV